MLFGIILYYQFPSFFLVSSKLKYHYILCRYWNPILCVNFWHCGATYKAMCSSETLLIESERVLFIHRHCFTRFKNGASFKTTSVLVRWKVRHCNGNRTTACQHDRLVAAALAANCTQRSFLIWFWKFIAIQSFSLQSQFKTEVLSCRNLSRTIM